VKPVVPHPEIDELVRDTLDTVLFDGFVDGSRQPLRIVVRESLVIEQQQPRVIHLVVQRFEILRVVREKQDIVFPTPQQQSPVGRLLSEAVFGLRDVITTLVKHALEDATDVFIEENVCRSAH
jgi:hypothetical protein